MYRICVPASVYIIGFIHLLNQSSADFCTSRAWEAVKMCMCVRKMCPIYGNWINTFSIRRYVRHCCSCKNQQRNCVWTQPAPHRCSVTCRNQGCNDNPYMQVYCNTSLKRYNILVRKTYRTKLWLKKYNKQYIVVESQYILHILQYIAIRFWHIVTAPLATMKQQWCDAWIRHATFKGPCLSI